MCFGVYVRNACMYVCMYCIHAHIYDAATHYKQKIGNAYSVKHIVLLKFKFD